MKRFNERKLVTIAGLVFMAAFLLAFQNCSSPVSFSSFELKANGNGTGYDGKPYVTIGTCDPASAQIDVKNKILIGADGSAQMTRQNCQDLATPQTVDPGAIRKSMIDSTAFVYEKEIYDYYDDNLSARKLTRALCWSTTNNLTTETAVWYYGDALVENDHSPEFYGQTLNSQSNTTGVIVGVTETYRSSTQVEYSAYTTSATGPNSTTSGFDLNMYALAGGVASTGTSAYGNMTCEINGVQSSIPGSTDCYLQAPTFP